MRDELAHVTLSTEGDRGPEIELGAVGEEIRRHVFTNSRQASGLAEQLVVVALGGYHIDGGTGECSDRPRSSVGGMSPLNDFCRRNHVDGHSFMSKSGKLIAFKVGARTYITYEAEIAWRNALPKLTPGPVARLNKTRPNPPSTRVA